MTQYRMLKSGDRLRAGDQWLSLRVLPGRWVTVRKNDRLVGLRVNKPGDKIPDREFGPQPKGKFLYNCDRFYLRTKDWCPCPVGFYRRKIKQ